MHSMKVWALGPAILAALLLACGGGDTPQEAAPYGNDWVITLDHGGFVLRYDCTLRTALRFEYALERDTGNLPRPITYSADPALPSLCGGQSNTASYASVHAGYDRGHLVPVNAMDDNPQYLQSANFMSNIVPQVSSLNQGLWEATDNVAECYRDVAPLRVYGGVVRPRRRQHQRYRRRYYHYHRHQNILPRRRRQRWRHHHFRRRLRYKFRLNQDRRRRL